MRLDLTTAKYLVKILSGELRIGLREGLVEAAIAKAFDRPLTDVKWAGMLTGDVGELATLARDDRLGAAEMELFRPLKFMLASPAEDANEILARLGPEVWVEDKYDGSAPAPPAGTRSASIRATSTTSRASRGRRGGRPAGTASSTARSSAGRTAKSCRSSLQARLGRKSPSDAIRAEVPVIFVAFDALALGPGDGAPVEPLLLPLTERRRRLDALELPPATDGGRFARSHLVGPPTRDTLEAAFSEARARRNEGLMVKDPDSGYSPGRRGLGWLKMKKALATIDCVVVGVEVGHGKRHGVLSDYTFAVRDTERERLVTIGKAYSGLTDAEIAEMTKWFEAHTIARSGRYRQVEPQVVVEVAFDVIVRSNRHQSLLRFADRLLSPRQVPRRDRHARVGGGPVQRPAARSGVPRHGKRAARRGATGLAHESGCPAPTADAMLGACCPESGRTAHGHPHAVHRHAHRAGHVRHASAPGHRHPQRARDRLHRRRDAVFDDFGTTDVAGPRRIRAAQSRGGAVRGGRRDSGRGPELRPRRWPRRR